MERCGAGRARIAAGFGAALLAEAVAWARPAMSALADGLWLVEAAEDLKGEWPEAE